MRNAPAGYLRVHIGYITSPFIFSSAPLGALWFLHALSPPATRPDVDLSCMPGIRTGSGGSVLGSRFFGDGWAARNDSDPHLGDLILCCPRSVKTTVPPPKARAFRPLPLRQW